MDRVLCSVSACAPEGAGLCTRVKFCRRLALCALALGAAEAGAQDSLDRVEEALTFSAPDGHLRARVSGLLDLEGYRFSQVAPGLINTTHGGLFNPRLTLLLDAQLGSKLYLFVQGRLD